MRVSAAVEDEHRSGRQGPNLIDVMRSRHGTVARTYLPPDANCLLSVADHCFRSRDYVNLIVIDKQPQLQWLDVARLADRSTIPLTGWSTLIQEKNTHVSDNF